MARARIFANGGLHIEGVVRPGITPASGGGNRGGGGGKGGSSGRGVGVGGLPPGLVVASLAAMSSGSGNVPNPPLLNYPQTILSDSPVGYWRLDESVGPSAADASTSGANGTYVNAPTLGVSPLISIGTAVTFAAASSQQVTIPNTPAFNNGSNKLTVECWIKTSQAGAGNPVFFSQDTGGSPSRVFQFRLSTTGTAEAIVLTGVDVPFTKTGAVTVNDGAIHYVCATYDGTTLLVYVDGVVDGAGTAVAGTLESGTTGTLIGSRNATGFFSGTIDEVARYTTALTASRVAVHYAKRA